VKGFTTFEKQSRAVQSVAFPKPRGNLAQKKSSKMISRIFLIAVFVAVLCSVAKGFLGGQSRWVLGNARQTGRLAPVMVTGKVHELTIAGDVGGVSELIAKDPTLTKARDIEGMTPLHHAARNGMVDMVQMLLLNGANVNSMNDKLRTPLQLATMYSDGKWGPEFRTIVEMMVRTGKADIMMIQRNDKMNALDYAKKAKWDKELKALWIENGSFSSGIGIESAPGPGGYPRD